MALVCLPWAGGTPGGYKKWLPYMHPRVEVWAAALPGREKRCVARGTTRCCEQH